MTEWKIREQSEPKIQSVAKQNKPQAAIAETFALLRLLTMFVKVIKEKNNKSRCFKPPCILIIVILTGVWSSPSDHPKSHQVYLY